MANALAEMKRAYIVLRDVAKAFDKALHDGLKYKLLRLGLPDILEKNNTMQFPGQQKGKYKHW